MKKLMGLAIVMLFSIQAGAQKTIEGRAEFRGEPIIGASIEKEKQKEKEGGKEVRVVTDKEGKFKIEVEGKVTLKISAVGFEPFSYPLDTDTLTGPILVVLEQRDSQMEEVVITGTMKEISRSNSPIPVEIITPKLFQKNPTPSLFEAVGIVNGVQPQLNCNVCNTGDIHINGMEGPYTMILIDGMPIVSALSTVYGLNGIPNSIVERIEVVKGPAASLYGSESMGGIINVITKNPSKAPVFSVDIFGTSWWEKSLDIGIKAMAGKSSALFGLNYFRYASPLDKNGDNFTDATLQNRISLFNKWNFHRKEGRVASFAARYVYENRWGGEMQWSEQWRGSSIIYGESIYTHRTEFLGLYQLPFKERIFAQASYNYHSQDSWYGTTPYKADQQVSFLQTYWDKRINTRHSLLTGISVRNTVYDDNTPGTASADGMSNMPSRTFLPGMFIQDEWTMSEKHTLLAGYRFDYHNHHGGVHSPRLAYKFSPNKDRTLRLSLGTGFRVVNLFTEDHSALTGAREVVILEKLQPERSLNGNINYSARIPTSNFYLNMDVTGFYSYFTNRITGDFDSDPNKIIYDNLKGHAVSRGISLNSDITFLFPLKMLLGVSFMDVYQVEKGEAGEEKKSVQLHAPRWSGNYIITYTLPRHFTLDLTGKWNGPMRLPILVNDYRPEYSPLHTIANLQVTKKWMNGFELYGGVKNLFNFVPKNPIMRPFDPFDRQVNDPSNPNGYTFDPSYNYASMQGLRLFLGLRLIIK